MRSLLLILLLVGTAHGLLGNIGNFFSNVGNTIQSVTNQIGQTATNLFNGATDHVNNAVSNVAGSISNIHGQVTNTINGIQVGSAFLWDNVFGPAYDMLVEGGQLFLDDKFGNLASSIGRRSVLPENILSKKYAELVARFKSSLHGLYESLFKLEEEALSALQKGENTVEEKIRSFYVRMDQIEQQINNMAALLKHELETYASTFQGEWVHALNQYSQFIDSSVKTMIKMFQQLTQSLLKNFIEAALTVVPDVSATIQKLKQEGLLAFL